jgi:NADPH:quinone reductase-like Zn-dependent oxidoreductase
MQAVVIREFGGPAVLNVEARADPRAPDGWELVELRAAGLNWHDCLIRSGVHAIPLPRIPGADGAGILRRTREPVLILPSIGWGSDERVPAAGWQILGDKIDGTYAELVAVPRANVLPLPDGWSFTAGAALPLAGLTAFRALFSRGQVRRGESVLIRGAGGGVATIATSLAHMAGCRVFVTTSTPLKLEKAKALGAIDGVLYTESDWPTGIRELSGGRGVDAVIDSVGGSWEDVLATLAPGGRLVSLGASASSIGQIAIRDLYLAQKSILGTTMGSPKDFRALTHLLSEHRHWRPEVDSVIPLEHASQAHAQMARRTHWGKLVLSIA